MQQVAAEAANVNALAAAGAGGGQSVDSISLKGGRFHIKRAGQQPMTLQLFNLDVVIIHANPGVTKAYFEGAWNPDEVVAPACSSDDGVTPRADSDTPQCQTCAACPQNQFGSYINPQTQAQSKACQDKKTLAVVTPGAEGGEMLRLQVPAASLKDFGNYMRGLPKVPYYGIITRISFDTTVSYPKIKFQAVDYLRDPNAFATAQQRHHSDEAKTIAGVAGFTGAPAGLPAPAAQPALAAPPAFMQQQAAPQQIPVQQIPVQQIQVQQIPVQQPQQGFGQVAQQPQQQPQYSQPQQQPQQQPQYSQPVNQPLSATPTPPPALAAVFGQQAPQQPAGTLPSGRVPGQPSPGKRRRTKAEMAEDAALGIGKAQGEQAEDEDQQPAPQQGFGQQQQAAPQPYQQPADQPQVIQGGAADAFIGWDD
jgi:hypothetical protein